MDDATYFAKRKAKEFAGLYPEPYYTGTDFEPHTWVIEAVKDAYRRGQADERSGVAF